MSDLIYSAIAELDTLVMYSKSKVRLTDERAKSELNKAEYSANESSKDPSTKVGARIISPRLTPVSEGYNGFVSGCDESVLSFDRPLKMLYTLHAEENAMIFASQDLNDHIMVSTHLPCVHCLRKALQYGIREFYYRYSDHVSRWSDNEKIAWANMLKSFQKRRL